MSRESAHTAAPRTSAEASSSRSCATAASAGSPLLPIAIMTLRMKRLARRELGLASLLRELVPRTHRQAIVAAVDAVAHRRAQLARDRALVLDRQVGDAAPRIEPVGRRKRRGRTDVEAGAADAAMIGLRRVGGELERREDRAE